MDSGDAQREQEWVAGVRNGDDEAFEAIFQTYYPSLCRFAQNYVGSFEAAREVVQEVFLRIWQRRTEWHVRAALKAYLYRAVRNQALNYAKKMRRRRAIEAEIDTEEAVDRRTAEDALRFEELAAVVERTIERLPERQRMAFVLHRRHGLSYEEIAQVMQISPRTVEVHVGKALKYLREAIPSAFA